MRKLLDEKLRRFRELEDQLVDPDVLSSAPRLAAVARELGLPCVVLSGSVVGPLDPLYELGVTAAFGINPAGEPLAVSLPRAAERLRQAAARTVLSFAKGELT